MNITRTAWRGDMAGGAPGPVGQGEAASRVGRAAPRTSRGADGQGVSVFVHDGGQVFHTYSDYGVGADVMLGTYRFLDLTPLGRQRYINEWPRHDTYGAPDRHEHHNR